MATLKETWVEEDKARVIKRYTNTWHQHGNDICHGIDRQNKQETFQQVDN